MSPKVKTVVIVGPSEIAEIIQKELSNFPHVKILDIVTEDTSKASDSILKHWPYAVYCALPSDHPDALALYHTCELTFCTFNYVIKPNPHSNRLIVTPWCREPLKKKWASILKRSFDIFASALFLVTIYPVIFLICTIGIKASGPGPIYYKQLRPGYQGNNFLCYKFRSMKVSSQNGEKAATKGDSRVTKFGNFIRKTSIDEFPQFINVFKGEMSIIGPRPQLITQSDYYSPFIPNYFLRHLVKPGITGWAQVNGCRGEIKSIEQMNDRINYDIWYIEHWSPKLDIKILFKTVLQVVKGDEQAY